MVYKQLKEDSYITLLPLPGYPKGRFSLPLLTQKAFWGKQILSAKESLFKFLKYEEINRRTYYTKKEPEVSVVFLYYSTSILTKAENIDKIIL